MASHDFSVADGVGQFQALRQANSGESALVIGCGMIGAEVIKQLREKGVHVHTAGNPSSQFSTCLR